MPGQWDTGRHRGLEIAAIVLLLFSAMLDPRLTLALAAALIVGALLFERLSENGGFRGR